MVTLRPSKMTFCDVFFPWFSPIRYWCCPLLGSINPIFGHHLVINFVLSGCKGNRLPHLSPFPIDLQLFWMHFNAFQTLLIKWMKSCLDLPSLSQSLLQRQYSIWILFISITYLPSIPTIVFNAFLSSSFIELIKSPS